MIEPKLSERIRPAILGGGGIITVNTETAEEWANEVAALEADNARLREALDIERLATIEHSQWMAWARTLMDEEPGLSAERRERWQEMMVDYSELPDEIKEYDREWARIIIGAALAQDDLSKLTTQQKPTEEAMEEA